MGAGGRAIPFQLAPDLWCWYRKLAFFDVFGISGAYQGER
jgi:hypothetical protein